MRVEVLKSFQGQIDGRRYGGGMGDVIDIPEGTDWIRAGFVRPVESAMMSPAKPKGGGTMTLAGRGIVKGYEDELAALGITTVPDLAVASIATLTQITGVGPVTAKRWRNAARELLT